MNRIQTSTMAFGIHVIAMKRLSLIVNSLTMATKNAANNLNSRGAIIQTKAKAHSCAFISDI